MEIRQNPAYCGWFYITWRVAVSGGNIWTDGPMLLKRPWSPHWQTPDTLTNKCDFSPMSYSVHQTLTSPVISPVMRNKRHAERNARLWTLRCCSHKWIRQHRNMHKLKEMVRNGKQRPHKLSQSQGKTAVSQIYGPLFAARKGKLVVATGLTVSCESDLRFDLMYHLY